VGVNRVTSQPVKGVTVRPTIEAARTAPQVPPQRSCRLGSWRWANHADTRRAFAEGTIDSEGVERIRIMAWDRTGTWVGTKIVPVDSDGSFDAEFQHGNWTGDMRIQVSCNPSGREPSDPDDVDD
jgi:hypothetical protein